MPEFYEKRAKATLTGGFCPYSMIYSDCCTTLTGYWQQNKAFKDCYI